MNELTKEQKLQVIEDCIKTHKIYPGYLCFLLAKSAFKFSYIDFLTYINIYHSEISTTLIPEFLSFKPEDKIVKGSWFGDVDEGSEKRLEVLYELYDLIEKQP
jgi:hypothetical protein